MRALLLSVTVLGLIVAFAQSEPAPASAQPVTTDDVRLVSEHMLSDNGRQAGKNGNTGRNGKSGQRVKFVKNIKG